MISTRAFVFSLAALGAMTLATEADAAPSKIRGADGDRPALDQIRYDRVAYADRADARDRDDFRRLGDDQRRVARDFYARNCPPGLAKKNNGCLPPGQAKKRYEVGRRLPDGYDGERLPDDLYWLLPALADDYDYRLLDGDLGIIERSTMIVMDAIGLY